MAQGEIFVHFLEPKEEMWNISISPAGEEEEGEDEEAQPVPDSRIPLENHSKTARGKNTGGGMKINEKIPQRVEQGQPPALEILKIHMEKVWRFLILFQF